MCAVDPNQYLRHLAKPVRFIHVKMTAVMTLTMLPALLLITAGPAVLALLRFFDKMG